MERRCVCTLSLSLSLGFRAGKDNQFSYTGTVGTWNARRTSAPGNNIVSRRSVGACVYRRHWTSGFGHRASGSPRTCTVTKPANHSLEPVLDTLPSFGGSFLPLFSFRDSVRGGGNSKRERERESTTKIRGGRA